MKKVSDHIKFIAVRDAVLFITGGFPFPKEKEKEAETMTQRKPATEWNREYGAFFRRPDTMELLKKIKKMLTTPLTIRFIYYGIWDIPDEKKMNSLQEVILKARKDIRRLIDPDMIVDGTRDPVKCQTFPDPEDFLAGLEYSYRRDFWKEQPVYYELWFEDASTVEMLQKHKTHLNREYRIIMRPCKGFTSATEIWKAHKFYKEIDMPVVILYFGDLNPSGWNMPQTYVRQFQELGIPIKLNHIALKPEQLKGFRIVEYTKVSADPRRKAFNIAMGYARFEKEPEQPCTEQPKHATKVKMGKKHLNIDLEKIGVDRFIQLVEATLQSHLDLKAIKKSKEIEEEEREKLREHFDEFEP